MKQNRNRKRLGAVLLGLTLTAALAGCSGKSSPAEIMKAAQEKMQAATSMSYAMTMDMEMEAAGQSIVMKMTGDADYIVDPAAMEMDMTVDMGEQGSMQSKVYLQEKDGAYTVYSGIDVGSGETVWSSQQMDMAALTQYDAQASMELYLSCADSFKENGTETINGAATTRYDGVISNDALSEVMTASGVLDQFSSLGLDETAAAAMLTDLGDLPISIWVENESNFPVQYAMDMTAMMQSMMSKAMESADSSETVSIGKVAMSMTINSLDSVESITVPEEALSAAQ